jgi:hypothetical protein
VWKLVVVILLTLLAMWAVGQIAKAIRDPPQDTVEIVR